MSQPNSRCQVLTTSEAYYVRLLNPAKKKTEHRGQEAGDLGDSAHPVAEGAGARIFDA